MVSSGSQIDLEGGISYPSSGMIHGTAERRQVPNAKSSSSQGQSLRLAEEPVM